MIVANALLKQHNQTSMSHHHAILSLMLNSSLDINLTIWFNNATTNIDKALSRRSQFAAMCTVKYQARQACMILKACYILKQNLQPLCLGSCQWIAGLSVRCHLSLGAYVRDAPTAHKIKRDYSNFHAIAWWCLIKAMRIMA